MIAADKAIGPDDLIDDGFKEFSVTESVRLHSRADRAFQKCIRDDAGRKLYYVTAYGYDLTKYRDRQDMAHMPPMSIQFDVQFYTDPDQRGFFNTTYCPAKDATVKPVLMFLHRLWETMSGVPYERHYDDQAKPRQS